MIDDVDACLRAMLSPRAAEHGAEVSFEAPTKEWATHRSGPTLDVYLFDIKEDLDRRAVAREAVLDGQTTIARRVPPRFFRLAYLLTAWTSRPEDEHRILADALATLVLVDVLPAEHLSGWLAEQPLAVAVEVALPMSDERSLADLWTALGGELKPSLEVVVTAPINAVRSVPVDVPPARERVTSAHPTR